MKSLIMTFCIAASCVVTAPISVYSDTISAEDLDAAVEAAVAAAIEGLATKEEVETAVAAATAGMYTQAEYDAATEGMYTQAEYDANEASCEPDIDSSFGLMNPANCRVADGYVAIVSGSSSWLEGSFKYANIRGTDGNGYPRYCKMDR